MTWIRLGVPLAMFGLAALPALAQKEYGFDNGKNSGQPYLLPEESLKRMKVPDGWEISLFAAEPDIINPVSFTVDEKGRLWVVECYEYPQKTPKGKKPRDRIKVLEDTRGTGKADKVTVWAEGKDFPPGEHDNGFDLATGIEVGRGGVFLGAAPYLFFLKDANGAGRCDSIEALLKGFGAQDTHETLNTLSWGPDGKLYGLHGIFTQSKIGDVQMNAAVWRYDAAAKQFDLFAEGTSNPWGLDFDQHGQAFLAACVIPHCFHMIPGGTYTRQAGNGSNPYAYGLLGPISDHLHHKESGWAHAGTLVLQGDQIPPEYRGSLLMGSIHGTSIKRDILERHGSTFVARHGPDFLVSEDKNFRPINLRWGPNGEIYVIDWHDQNPCHQAAPDSWDLTHGRIYKIQRKGAKTMPAPDLGKASSMELVQLLKNNNPWSHRTALRLLGERRDASVAPALKELLATSGDEVVALRALEGLFAVGALDEATTQTAVEHKSPWVRSWAVRLAGEAGKVSLELLKRFTAMAEKDSAPEVRLQLASTAQRLKGQDTLPLLQNLLTHKEDARDACLPLMIWLAYEPRVPADGHPGLGWLKEHAAGNLLVTEEIVPRTLRRLVATGKADDLAACVAFLGDVKDAAVRRHGLAAMLAALQNRQIDPPANWKAVQTDLLADADTGVQRMTRRLAVNFRDVEAMRRSLTTAQDARKPVPERIDALRDLALGHPAEALQPLEALLTSEPNAAVLGEVCRTLAGYDKPEVASAVLAGWTRYAPPVRIEAVNLLAGRKDWAAALLAAVGKKEVPRTDLNDNTILRIRALKNDALNKQIEAVWGRVRDTPAELNALIDKMRGDLHEGRASLARGVKVFETQCAKCHKFEGKGHEVGPNLDGAARDIEYLLINVLDPNRVVGAPYYTRFIELKDGTVDSGLLQAEDNQSVTLKKENDAVRVIQRKDIDKITISEKSVMPEGLANNMTVQDFRDLVRYVMASPYLTDVAVVGPLPPDKVLPLDLADPLAAKDVTWQWPLVGVQGRIPLPSVKGEGQAVAQIAAEVTAPAALKTKLQLGAAHPLKVWLNGKEVYSGKPGNGAPDQAGIDVDLRAGANQILIQATYKGDHEGLYARLLDAQRKLTLPEGKR